MYQEDVYVMLLHRYLGKNPGADEKDFLIYEIERRSSDSIENVLNTPLNKLHSNIRYFKIKLDRLPPKNKTKSKKKSLPYQIALLEHIGFFQLEYFKRLPQSKVDKITALLLNSNERSVRGNRSALKDGNVGHQKYTSYTHKEKIDKDLNNL